MTVIITMKTPDLYDQVSEGFNEEEQKILCEALSRWVKYGEYVRIKFDTNTGTAEVLPVKQ